MAFAKDYTSLPCAPVRSYDFLGVTMRFHAFSMNPNWPLLEIIFQLRGILCFQCGLVSDFIVDPQIPRDPNLIDSNQP